MFSARMTARLAGLALVGAGLALPATAMAGVVVKASGPSATRYPVGTKLDDDASITLKAGDSITVLTSGGTRVMQGEGTYRVGDRPTETRERFSALTRKRAANRVRTGAVRTGAEDGPVSNPNLWFVDVSQSGTFCLFDFNRVRLWRADSEKLATYRFAHPASATRVDVTFDEGGSLAPIDPTRIAINEGASYTITGPTGSTSANVTFMLLDGEYEAPDALAEALLDKGCTGQVALLADKLGG